MEKVKIIITEETAERVKKALQSYCQNECPGSYERCSDYKSLLPMSHVEIIVELNDNIIDIPQKLHPDFEQYIDYIDGQVEFVLGLPNDQPDSLDKWFMSLLPDLDKPTNNAPNLNTIDLRNLEPQAYKN